jgi:hypothetical protein
MLEIPLLGTNQEDVLSKFQAKKKPGPADAEPGLEAATERDQLLFVVIWS